MAASVLNSVFGTGGRIARYGEFSIVYMHTGAFITTPMELMAQQNWARARVSCGNAVKDRNAFVDRFETVLARAGSGLSTKGSRGLLQRIVKAMTAAAVPLESWSIPLNLNESMEMKKKAVVPAMPVPVVPT
jgi:hypothetical protein